MSRGELGGVPTVEAIPLLPATTLLTPLPPPTAAAAEEQPMPPPPPLEGSGYKP